MSQCAPDAGALFSMVANARGKAEFVLGQLQRLPPGTALRLPAHHAELLREHPEAFVRESFAASGVPPHVSELLASDAAEHDFDAVFAEAGGADVSVENLRELLSLGLTELDEVEQNGADPEVLAAVTLDFLLLLAVVLLVLYIIALEVGVISTPEDGGGAVDDGGEQDGGDGEGGESEEDDEEDPLAVVVGAPFVAPAVVLLDFSQVQALVQCS